MGHSTHISRQLLTASFGITDLICRVAGRVHLCDKSNMSDAKQQLECALDTALAQYTETMGMVFPIVPILEVIHDPDFWAIAEMRSDAFHIRVSTGTANNTNKLWFTAFADDDFRASFVQALGTDTETMTNISLVWLMLHEMHHFQMGHFELIEPTRQTETQSAGRFGLVQRARKSSRKCPDVPQADAEKVKLCLEMQADHDASEMLLDAYSLEEWNTLRARVTGISAMMMLIERADALFHPTSPSHPKAATRIFQLLGHLIDMPLLSAHAGNDTTIVRPFGAGHQPSKDEREHFITQVIVPAFSDATALARKVSAQSIVNDLGSAAGFFQDVQAVKLMGTTEAAGLITSGARQWADLVGVNMKLSS